MSTDSKLDAAVAALIIAAALLGVALIMGACGGCGHTTVYIPPTPDEPQCLSGTRPQRPEDACDSFTASGFQCARCSNPASKDGSAGTTSCVDVLDGVYCVASCGDPMCGPIKDYPVTADGGTDASAVAP